MKIFKRIICFFLGHVPWSHTNNTLQLCHQDIDYRMVSIEVCPRCFTLWGNVPKSGDLLKDSDISKLAYKEDPLYPSFEFPFKVNNIVIKENPDLTLNEFEIVNSTGSISLWELDETSTQPIIEQIENCLLLIANPVQILCNRTLMQTLDFTTINKGPYVSGGNAQGTVSQQKPVSTGVSGPGVQRKL